MTTTPKISLQELYNMRESKRRSQKECFDTVLEKCHYRIRNVANHGGQCCFFEIPPLIIGLPLFNRGDCIENLVSSLRRVGFLVQILPEPHLGVVYISWNPVELKPAQPALRRR